MRLQGGRARPERAVSAGRRASAQWGRARRSALARGTEHDRPAPSMPTAANDKSWLGSAATFQRSASGHPSLKQLRRRLTHGGLSVALPQVCRLARSAACRAVWCLNVPAKRLGLLIGLNSVRSGDRDRVQNGSGNRIGIYVVLESRPFSRRSTVRSEAQPGDAGLCLQPSDRCLLASDRLTCPSGTVDSCPARTLFPDRCRTVSKPNYRASTRARVA